MQHLYPELGIDLGERAYGADCRLYIEGHGVNWPVIRATLFDEFVVAHTLGWWAKVHFQSDLQYVPGVCRSDQSLYNLLQELLLSC